MRKSKFTEEQIITAIKRHEAGIKTSELCRELGISQGTFYKWKAKYGGMDVSQARKLKAFEEENRRLKTMVADLSLDKQALQWALEKKPRYGMPTVHLMLRRGGLLINRKKTARIYRAAGLQIKTRPPKRKRRRPISELPKPTGMMQKWSMDFVHDNLACGRAIRTLNILDEYNRESVKIEVDTSLPSLRVVHVLNRLKATIGLPKEIGVDSGPEFTSDIFQQWAKDNGVKLGYCQPGKKNQNAFIESFNARFRDDCLNMHWFMNLEEARDIIERWRVEYNTERPHSSLGGLTPLEYGRDHVYKIAG